MAKKRSADTAAADADAQPRQWRVQLKKSVKHGGTWLRPGSARVLVDEATLAMLNEQDAVASAEEVR